MFENTLVPYFRRRTELSLHDGCILWGSQVVVPQEGQESVLVQLHEGKPRNHQNEESGSYVYVGCQEFQTILK